ncbi:hypothetical protein J6Z48_03290 [bacterium]|nr:hypothetical protein [bacterium]
MKEKRGVIALALVAAVLVLGVGYATLTSQTLYINGNASLAQGDVAIDVVFYGNSSITPSITDISNRNGNALAATASAADDSTVATLNITNLEEAGDSVTAIYQIKNKSADIDATLSTGTITKDAKLDVTVSYGTTSLAHGQTTTVTVTATLNATPTNTISETISIPVVATPA